MLPTEAQLVDYFIFDAEDIDVGTFSRAKTDEVAAHFKIDEKAAYRALNVLAKKGVLTKTRDIMKRHKGKHAVGFQWWEYGWKPEDRERHAQRQTHEVAMARKTRREPEHDAHAAGADYAREQLAGAYFQDWVWEQMVEAERMRAADPSSVLPLETPADARKVARNMLQQLGWDTKRELKESKEFFEGFDEVLQSQSSIDWLADMILDFDKEAREKTAPEAARKTRREPEHDAHKAGADYAREQLAGAYFQDWVWEQMVEAERMRAADPSSVLPLETPADARKVARNMLQQLGWDTKRELKESKEFFEGFDEVLQSQSSIDWLADMILDFDKEAREKTAPEAREAREAREAGGRCQLAWSRTTQASTATGAKGLFKVESKPDGWYVTLDGGKLGVYAERKGAERAAERFEADESIPARREAAEAPAGKEAREARRGSRGKKTFEAYALEVEQALVASGVRPGQAAVWTSNHGAFIDKELKDGASANDTAERILESERESSIPYGRESRRPVAPYYSRKR